MVSPVAGKNLNSPFAEQRQRGFPLLRFIPFVEEEFRQHFVAASVQRARLVVGAALVTILVLSGMRLADWAMSGYMLLFDALVMAPVLGATLWASTQAHRHRLYQLLLMISALLIGLVINSVVTRAGLQGMPYYFAASVAWFFMTWLILGLLFRFAATAAAAISATYIWGVFFWDLPPAEAAFETIMLLVVNAIGAFCSYQLEYALRRSFLESRVLSELAERDGLTGLYNRRSHDQYIQRVWRQSRREQTQLTLLMIDIDHFKAYNDVYGHQAGDDALKRVADVIGLSAQRPLDFAARFGGEEFALILYGPAQDYGRELPEQIRADVAALKIPHKRSPTGPYLSVSVGVAIVMPGADRSLAGAIQMADEALYQAKEQGRNRVVVKESLSAHIETGKFRAEERRLSA